MGANVECPENLWGIVFADSHNRGNPHTESNPTEVFGRSDVEWDALAEEIGEDWARAEHFARIAGRLAQQDELDRLTGEWTRRRDKFETARALQARGLPAAAVQRPEERIERDPNTQAWGLWPEVKHSAIGAVRVDGLPIHLSETDWEIARGAPCLGEHNGRVFGEILGLDEREIEKLREDGVI